MGYCGTGGTREGTWDGGGGAELDQGGESLLIWLKGMGEDCEGMMKKEWVWGWGLEVEKGVLVELGMSEGGEEVVMKLVAFGGGGGGCVEGLQRRQQTVHAGRRASGTRRRRKTEEDVEEGGS